MELKAHYTELMLKEIYGHEQTEIQKQVLDELVQDYRGGAEFIGKKNVS
jgi:hypothetical protein